MAEATPDLRAAVKCGGSGAAGSQKLDTRKRLRLGLSDHDREQVAYESTENKALLTKADLAPGGGPTAKHPC